MTSRQIEALVQAATENIHKELGFNPEILVTGYDEYIVELHYADDRRDITEKVKDCIDEEELTQFFSNDILNAVREFYGKVMQGKQERNPEWDQSVFMYDHTFTELFDALMNKAGSMMSDLEDNEDTDANDDKQYKLLGDLFQVYGECMSTSMSDI